MPSQRSVVLALAVIVCTPLAAAADTITISHDSTYQITDCIGLHPCTGIDTNFTALVDGFRISALGHFHVNGDELATFYNDATGILVQRIDGTPFRLVSAELDLTTTVRLGTTLIDVTPYFNNVLPAVDGTMVFGDDWSNITGFQLAFRGFVPTGISPEARETLVSFTIAPAVPEPNLVLLGGLAAWGLVARHRLKKS